MKINKFIITNIVNILLLNNFVSPAIAAPTTLLIEDENFEYNYAALTGVCQIYDPYESINRKFFKFNGILDWIFLRPIAKGYGKLTNQYTKDRIDSILNNAREPLSTVNYGFQGKKDGIIKTFWRFAINTTFGLAGTFDIASKFGLTATPQTFGNTLEHYGVAPGPYLVVPFLGGVGARDLMDVLVLNSTMNPVNYFIGQPTASSLSHARMIHFREKRIPFTDYVTKNSTDPYITIRDAVMNERESKRQYPQGFVCPAVK